MSKINKITVSNFTKHKNTEFEFSNGINILIGENGTGKTHLLKLLYVFLNTLRKNANQEEVYFNQVSSVFRASTFQDLVTNNSGKEATINYLYDNTDYSFSIFANETDIERLGNDESKFKNIVCKKNEGKKLEPSFVYIPTQEIISTYLDFRSIYEKYETKYESTYYDLSCKLQDPFVKEISSLADIHQEIAKILGGNVSVDNGIYSIDYGSSKIAAPLLAEGFKKIALYDILICNGNLTENSILFIDEPEVHLNPRYISHFTDLIVSLARKGVQIFIATHDYLLSHQLSLQSEYSDKIENTPDMKFFCLEDSLDGLIVHEGTSLSQIEHNPILDEFVKHYDKEQELFNL